jgi:hypothetical protein
VARAGRGDASEGGVVMADNYPRPDLERMYKMRSSGSSGSGGGGGSSRSGGGCLMVLSWCGLFVAALVWVVLS